MLRVPATLACLVAAAGSAFGGNGEDKNDWLELDREITNLHRSILAQDDNNLRFGLDLIVSGATSDDPFYQIAGDDLAGFQLRRARLTARGNVGNASYKISGELSSGTLTLRDAYASWKLSDASTTRFGRYKTPLLWGGFSSAFYELFHDKTITSGQNDDRQIGVYWNHSIGQWSWILNAQNGVDGQSDDLFFVGRIQYDVLGDTAFGKYHGAYGYDDHVQLSVAVSAADDQGIDDGTLTAAEVGLVTNGFSLRADAVQYDEDYDDPLALLDPDEILGTSKADTSPFTVTGTYLFGNSRWELIGRLEEFDDDMDTSRASGGLIYYSEAGPEGRWAFLVQDMSSDDPLMEGTRIELSFSLASSG